MRYTDAPKRANYLDDPDHEWELDPATVRADPTTTLIDFLYAAKGLPAEDLKLIVDGAWGLVTRDKATSAEAIATSMIWFFG